MDGRSSLKLPALAATVLAVTLAGTPAHAQSDHPGASAPEPLAAWGLDGDGRATVGGEPHGIYNPQSLRFIGVHEFDPDSVVLDGYTAYGATRGPGPLDTTSSFTAEGWVTLAREAEFANVLSQIGDVAAAFFLGTASGEWAFSMKDLDTNEPGHTFRAVAERATVDPETWVHLAGVFDGAVGEIRLYIDGDLAAAAAFDAPWQAGGPITVGGSRARGGPADFWPGAIAHAAVYQSALTDEQIASLRASTRPGTTPPLLSADPASYAHGVLDGTWDYRPTDDEVDFMASLFSPEELALTDIQEADTSLRLGFSGQAVWQGSVFDGELWLVDGHPEGDAGTFTVEGDELTVTNGRDGWATYRWSLEEGELELTLLRCVQQSGAGECPDIDIVRFMSERTWSHSGSDPTY